MALGFAWCYRNRLVYMFIVAFLLVFWTCRQKRMAEILARQKKEVYGSLREITGVYYVDEVNKAGQGVWVVLHLYQSRYPP